MGKNFDGIMVKEGYELMAYVRVRCGNYAYAIIHRLNVDDYVLCIGYDRADGTWGQGHYFSSYSEAVEDMCKYLA